MDHGAEARGIVSVKTEKRVADSCGGKRKSLGINRLKLVVWSMALVISLPNLHFVLIYLEGASKLL